MCKTFDGAWKDSKIDEIVGARLKWKVFVSFHAIYRREAAHPTSSQVSSRRDKRRRRRRLDGRGSTELFHFITISFSSFKARVSAAAIYMGREEEKKMLWNCRQLIKQIICRIRVLANQTAISNFFYYQTRKIHQHQTNFKLQKLFRATESQCVRFPHYYCWPL